MKIYTEVNYIWKDDKLIQTDSQSFDYEGEIESCHWYHKHGGGDAFNALKVNLDTAVSATAVAVSKPFKDNKVDKPGGSLKEGLTRLKIIS